MRVDALMSTDLATVRADTDLRVAIGEMRLHDCGSCPWSRAAAASWG